VTKTQYAFFQEVQIFSSLSVTPESVLVDNTETFNEVHLSQPLLLN